MKLGVHVRYATGLPVGVDPFVRVRVEKEKENTKVVDQAPGQNSETFTWDHFFTFPVREPDAATVKFKVVDAGKFLRNKVVGKAEIPFREVLQHDPKTTVKLDLKDPKKDVKDPKKDPIKDQSYKGFLFVSFYHKQPALEKPLKVLCATWNVGNTAPPKDLSAWLKDCKSGTYDLIAVGAQECQFSSKGVLGSTSLSQHGSGNLMGLAQTSNGSTLLADNLDADSLDNTQVGISISSITTTPTVTPTSLTPTLTPTAATLSSLVDGNPFQEPAALSAGEEDKAGSTPRLNAVSQLDVLLAQRLQLQQPEKQQVPDALDFLSSPFESVRFADSALGEAHQAKTTSKDWNPDMVASMTSLQISAVNTIADKLATDGASAEAVDASTYTLDSTYADAMSNTDTDTPFEPEELTYGNSSWDGTSGKELPEALPLPPLPSKGMSTLKEDTQPVTPPGSDGRKYKKTTRAALKKFGHRIYYGKGALTFEEVVTDAVGDQYVLVDRKNMGQVRLLVFARFDISCAINWVESKSEGTGVANKGTNKGAAAVALQVGATTILFVSCHLAAHQGKCEARAKDYRDIVDGLDMDPHQMDAVTAFHHVVFMGDMNYRLNWGEQAKTFAESPTPTDFVSLETHIQQAQAEERYDDLLVHDQLREQMRAKNVFVGFKEAPITFAPTFKMLRNERSKYDSKRSPAWTDRVLTLSTLPHLMLEVHEYFSAPDITTSDHKPVAAVVSMPLVLNTLAAARERADPSEPPKMHFALRILSLESTSPLKHFPSLSDALLNPPVLRIFSTALHPDCAGMIKAELRPDVPKGQGQLLRDGPLTIRLLPGPTKDRVQDMTDDCLKLRIVGTQSVPRSIGRAVLPLRQAVEGYLASPGSPCPLDVHLLDDGIVVGRLHIQMMLEKCAPVRRSGGSASELARSAPYPGFPLTSSEPVPPVAPHPSATLQIVTKISGMDLLDSASHLVNQATGHLAQVATHVNPLQITRSQPLRDLFDPTPAQRPSPIKTSTAEPPATTTTSSLDSATLSTGSSATASASTLPRQPATAPPALQRPSSPHLLDMDMPHPTPNPPQSTIVGNSNSTNNSTSSNPLPSTRSLQLLGLVESSAQRPARLAHQGSDPAVARLSRVRHPSLDLMDTNRTLPARVWDMHLGALAASPSAPSAAPPAAALPSPIAAPPAAAFAAPAVAPIAAPPIAPIAAPTAESQQYQQHGTIPSPGSAGLGVVPFQQPSGHALLAAGSAVRTLSRAPHIAGSGLQSGGGALPTMGSAPHTMGGALPVMGSAPHTVGGTLQSGGGALPVMGRTLPASSSTSQSVGAALHSIGSSTYTAVSATQVPSSAPHIAGSALQAGGGAVNTMGGSPFTAGSSLLSSSSTQHTISNTAPAAGSTESLAASTAAPATIPSGVDNRDTFRASHPDHGAVAGTGSTHRELTARAKGYAALDDDRPALAGDEGAEAGDDWEEEGAPLLDGAGSGPLAGLKLRLKRGMPFNK